MVNPETIPVTEQHKLPETIQLSGIPRAAKALESLHDINLSVIYVQLEVGNNLAQEYGVDASAFYISPDWWDENVGHTGTFREMAEAFDSSYQKLVSQRVAEITQSDVIIGEDTKEMSIEQIVPLEPESTEASNRSYEMLENLGNALAEAEDNAIAFADMVDFDADEEYSEAFLVDLVAHVAEKYALSLNEEELDKVHDHVKAVFKERQSEKLHYTKLATATYEITEGGAANNGQSFDEYNLSRRQAFANINKGETPSADGLPEKITPETYDKRQQLLERYKEFENFWNTAEAERNLIASGLDSDVYAHEQSGEQYIIRIVKNERLAENPAKTDDYITALIHGKGIQGLEQIVAASYKDGVVVSERAPGKSLEQLIEVQPEEVNKIPDEHLEKLLEVFIQMQARGLVADVNQGNLIYDRELGFTIVDYMWCPPEYWGEHGQSLEIKINAFEDMAKSHFPDLSRRLLQLASHKHDQLGK